MKKYGWILISLVVLIVVTVVIITVKNRGTNKIYSTYLKPFSESPSITDISFVEESYNQTDNLIVAYTNDLIRLWTDRVWVRAVYEKMEELSKTYSTILLFNGKQNMPDVSQVGMGYPERYDRYLVCGYWK